MVAVWSLFRLYNYYNNNSIIALQKLIKSGKINYGRGGGEGISTLTVERKKSTCISQL